MVAVAKNISLILKLEEGDVSNIFLQLLRSTSKLLAGLHYQHSIMMRALVFILPGIDEKYRELLKKSNITIYLATICLRD